MERKKRKWQQMNVSTSRSGSPWRVAFRKFFGNRLSLYSSLFVGAVALMAFLGYLIAPDSTPWANNQHLEIATKKPGFKADFFLIPNKTKGEKRGFFSGLFMGWPSSCREVPMLSYRLEDWNIILTEYTEPEDSLTIESTYSVQEILFPNQKPENIHHKPNLITIVDYNGITEEHSAADIELIIERDFIKTQRFWLGTDRFGRDMLSRLIIGARISLAVGFIAVAISLIIGIILGALAGYVRGWFDDFIMWFVNVVWSIPTLLMVIALTMVLGKGFWQIFVAVGLTMWVEVARVVRGQVMSLREKEFVEAAQVLGFGKMRIIFRHILPNVMGPVAIISAGNFATAILLEAGLSFLGIGVQPPIPSWGTMIKDHYGFLIMDKAFLAIMPGVAIMLLVLAFTLIGNGLRDALDPKELE
ncbi:MAG TPA: ABC transporter permease [Perlabentimonas sp.]|nr:ABC transporter permease [Perlabentimonas sp.]